MSAHFGSRHRFCSRFDKSLMDLAINNQEKEDGYMKGKKNQKKEIEREIEIDR
jgi:hypothetical protein